MPLLNSQFTLLDIRDVESFTGRIVERSKLHLNPADREDLHAFLVEECWILSTRYTGGPRFSTWAGTTLRHRLVDWQRKRFGRTRWVFRDHVYERPRPTFVSLDSDDPDGDRLGDTLPAIDSDPADNCGSDLGRVLESRDREAARHIAAMGLPPHG